MRKKTVLIACLAVLTFGSLFFWRAGFLQEEEPNEFAVEKKLQTATVAHKEDGLPKVEQAEINSERMVSPSAKQEREIKVPFISQAPLGDWSDERFQNGCEEASVMMAMRWIRGETFSSPAEAQQGIVSIAKFEEQSFGNYIDASVEEVGKIFLQYYGFKNFTIRRSFALDDLKSEFGKGNIVLVPAYGRALKNPNYTRPGPITHMLVITGYDAATGEFITNDPGTKRGEGYRYREDVLFAAIWAYPAGKSHPQPPKTTESKAMIVVEDN